MLPDRVSNLGPLTYESGALPIALRGPAGKGGIRLVNLGFYIFQHHFSHVGSTACELRGQRALIPSASVMIIHAQQNKL